MRGEKDMSSSDFDSAKPNLLGGLDKMATQSAIAILAVFPTFFTCVFRPARLRPLIDQIEPDGRKGLLLAPGAFFFLALFVAFILAAMMSTPETISRNGSYIGPDLAVRVQSAAAEGNFWKLLGTILPIYGAAIMVGLLGLALKPFAGEGWSLQSSIRTALYVMGVIVSWALLTTAVVDLAQLRAADGKDMSFLYIFAGVPAILVFFWIYLWVFRNGGMLSWRRSVLLALSMFGLIFLVIFGLELLVRL